MAFSRYAAAPAVDLVSSFASAAAEVGATIPSCDMGAAVPACPGWSTYDLVVHLGNVHAWAATTVETGRRTPEQDDEPPSRRRGAVAGWYTGKAEDLLAVLRSADPDAECWTFTATDRTQAFWQRRQAHETLVHLVDLHQAARGTAYLPPVLFEPGGPGAFAADGVAEVLEVFLPRMHARGRRADLRAPLLLNASDTGDTWLLTPTGGAHGGPGDAPPEVQHVTGEDLVERGTDLVTAPGPVLLMLLWKRCGTDAPGVTLDGDRDRLLHFLRSPLTP